MRKKILIPYLTFYAIFIVFIYFYLFNLTSSSLPSELVGTSADPATFLTEEQLFLSNEYSAIRNFMFFIEIPLEWLFYLLILLLGIGKLFEKWAKETTKSKIFHSAIFTFCLSVLSNIFFYPIRYIRYTLAKDYGISTQSFQEWMRDSLIGFWIDWLLLFIIVTAIYWLMRRSEKRWWLYTWFLSIPFIIFMMFIQPVIIDPLYNEFYPIQNQELENKILSLADTAGIPVEHVYEVDMSEKTNALNAYVTGVGSNARIVLYDTTLTELSDDEILFIMAHEMAHYVEKHIYIGIAGYLLMLLAVLFIISKIINFLTKKYGQVLHISSVKNLSSLPLILLIISVLTFAASPVSNAVSRYQETRADEYAIEVTKDVDAGITTFQELTRSGLSQVNPPPLVKWFRYGHPTMLERILLLKSYEDTIE